MLANSIFYSIIIKTIIVLIVLEIFAIFSIDKKKQKKVCRYVELYIIILTNWFIEEKI